ncbi:hypothetical protein ACE6H2_018350 [Prunus campanulata]
MSTAIGTVQAICKKVWKGNPIATTMKNVSRGLAALTVPFTMSFPKRCHAHFEANGFRGLMAPPPL